MSDVFKVGVFAVRVFEQRVGAEFCARASTRHGWVISSFRAHASRAGWGLALGPSFINSRVMSDTVIWSTCVLSLSVFSSASGYSKCFGPCSPLSLSLIHI